MRLSNDCLISSTNGFFKWRRIKRIKRVAHNKFETAAEIGDCKKNIIKKLGYIVFVSPLNRQIVDGLGGRDECMDVIT